MSYAYHAVSSYFNRDNVALPGFVTYFRNASMDERGHAQKLMDFQVLPTSLYLMHVADGFLVLALLCFLLVPVLSWVSRWCIKKDTFILNTLRLLTFIHKHIQVALKHHAPLLRTASKVSCSITAACKLLHSVQLRFKDRFHSSSC